MSAVAIVRRGPGSSREAQPQLAFAWASRERKGIAGTGKRGRKGQKGAPGSEAVTEIVSRKSGARKGGSSIFKAATEQRDVGGEEARLARKGQEQITKNPELQRE